MYGNNDCWQYLYNYLFIKFYWIYFAFEVIVQGFPDGKSIIHFHYVEITFTTLEIDICSKFLLPI